MDTPAKDTVVAAAEPKTRKPRTTTKTKDTTKTAKETKARASKSESKSAAASTKTKAASKTKTTTKKTAEKTAETKPKTTRGRPKKVTPRVLFAMVEAAPFMKTGGLGDVGGSLPAELVAKGADVTVVLPKFSGIAPEYMEKMEYVGNRTVPLSWRNEYCGVFKLVMNNITYFFLDNERYFYRDSLYGYFDDAERMAFFSKAVLECLPVFGKNFPHVIHSHDWHTALVPVYLREQYNHIDEYRDIKTVYTVHNLKYQGIFPPEVMGHVLGLDFCPSAVRQLTKDGCVNFMQGALLYSDKLTTVSPTYAEEVKSDYFGENMQHIFRDRESVLSGILNGIDTEEYNPKTDKHITENFDSKTLDKKVQNKLKLQEKLGLPQNPEIPLFVMITRLTQQKGIDLLTHILDELLYLENVQVAVLGTGDYMYESSLWWFKNKYPEKIALSLKFSEALSHEFYAGGDFLLMPSLFEPCGLSQMISMSYGTLPIVRETGGLSDTVIPYNENTGEGNGYSFSNYNAHEFLETIKRAADVYRREKDADAKLRQNAMSSDFKWSSSASKYIDIYKELMGQ